MSTKTTTNSTQALNFDSASKGVFDTLQPKIGENMAQDMQLDPTKSTTFNLGLQNALRANNVLKMRQSQNIFQNLQGSGFAGSVNPFQQAQMNRMARAGGAMDAQGTNQNFLNYDMMRRQATAQAMQYRPLQTGQTTDETQTKSGLGTWLPQVIGMGAQVGLGLATGGMSGMANAGMAAGGQAAGGFAGTLGGAQGSAVTGANATPSYFSNASPYGSTMFSPYNYSSLNGTSNNYFSGGH